MIEAIGNRWDQMNRKEIRAMQLGRLRALVRDRLLPFSPFYARRLDSLGLDHRALRRIEDLAAFPFTTKADVVPSAENPDGPRAFVLKPDAEAIRTRLPRMALIRILAEKLLFGADRLQRRLIAEYNPTKILFTTGRSAASLPFFLTRYDLELLEETGRRITRVLGLDPRSDRVVSLFPYAPHLAFWQVAACSEAAGVLTVDTGGGRVMESDRILDLIGRLKPTTLCGMPGYFYHLLRKARNEGHAWPFVRKIALGGEGVPSVLKQKIVAILGEMGAEEPRVSSVYGFTEARQCWAECLDAENTGFHTSPDLCLIEIVDPKTGEILPEGSTGEIVYTGLDGRGSSLLRYRTGDVVEGGLTHEPCPGCGRVLPRISSRIRRESNQKTLDVAKVKGAWIDFNALAEMLGAEAAIEEWQIVLAKKNDDPFEVDEIELWCALAPQFDRATFRERIQRGIAGRTEIHFNRIETVSLDEMLARLGMETKTKEERIVDRRPKREAREEVKRS